MLWCQEWPSIKKRDWIKKVWANVPDKGEKSSRACPFRFLPSRHSIPSFLHGNSLGYAARPRGMRVLRSIIRQHRTGKVFQNLVTGFGAQGFCNLHEVTGLLVFYVLPWSGRGCCWRKEQKQVSKHLYWSPHPPSVLLFIVHGMTGAIHGAPVSEPQYGPRWNHVKIHSLFIRFTLTTNISKSHEQHTCQHTYQIHTDNIPINTHIKFILTIHNDHILCDYTHSIISSGCLKH